MAKKKTVYHCKECGHASGKWLGKCPSCNQWDTFVEEFVQPDASPDAGSRAARGDGKAVAIGKVKAEHETRINCGVEEVNRILGGGLVPGSVVLIAGEPGVGKSTLMLQVAHWIATSGTGVFYATAEESAMQLRLRAERIGCVADNLFVMAENRLDAVMHAAEQSDCGVLVMDSVQMAYWSELAGAPGSVGQVRECTAALSALAKRTHMAVLLVGHVTKDGAIAGPKVLEHMVDVVLSFEGDRFHAARILRASKNRYGAVGEIGVFEMMQQGLTPVSDPSRLFLSGYRSETPGSVVTASLEGSQPFLVEVQALVAPGLPGNPRRRVSGMDQNRAAMILAVLEKRCGLALCDKDVYLNVVGGAQLDEPGSDLAIALAVASSLQDQPFPEGIIAFGEIGLGGEVRPVARMEARLKEASRLGFISAICPPLREPKSSENKPDAKTTKSDFEIRIYPAKMIEDALLSAHRARQ